VKRALILVATRGGPTMLARIGIMTALNRHVIREFNPESQRHALGQTEVEARRLDFIANPGASGRPPRVAGFAGARRRSSPYDPYRSIHPPPLPSDLLEVMLGQFGSPNRLSGVHVCLLPYDTNRLSASLCRRLLSICVAFRICLTVG
jgi:hypothetical protein